MKVLAFVCIVAAYCSVSLAADDASMARLREVTTDGSCPTDEISALFKRVKPDAELIFKLLKSENCNEGILGEAVKIAGLPVFGEAARTYLDDFERTVVAEAKQNLENGRPAFLTAQVGSNELDVETVKQIATRIGFLNGVAETGCKKKVKKLCEQLARTEKAQKTLVSLVSQKPKVSLDDLCLHGDNLSCAMRTEAFRGHNGYTRPANWDSAWVLSQITGEYAVFQRDGEPVSGQEFLIAVERKSIKGALNSGVALPAVAPCLKYLSRTTMENVQGFGVSVARYRAIHCE